MLIARAANLASRRLVAVRNYIFFLHGTFQLLKPDWLGCDKVNLRTDRTLLRILDVVSVHENHWFIHQTLGFVVTDVRGLKNALRLNVRLYHLLDLLDHLYSAHDGHI